jgi:hypothetical protein
MEKPMTLYEFFKLKHNNFFKFLDTEMSYAFKLYPKLELLKGQFKNDSDRFMTYIKIFKKDDPNKLFDNFVNEMNINTSNIQQKHLNTLKQYLFMFHDIINQC